ncbi:MULTISPECIES: DUF3135 domain-containing protein [Vibrio]|uniref:DUF3135 domain-containing protein n=1 Tax=Vibrio TaxID=662 RepID=UPI0001B94EB8|nr:MULTISPECIES: DUF3135 domain-containing protein [Vibrio]EEX30722.1 hypothetical protein VIC_005018 [Vibrio coralliilyticus ATCC BAA-450]MCM5509495.1 DUF3135 domain-containing protein [Vibrio sp. SCSIO 43169]MDE3899622.1 DUF3135 domain-containing protein [Vibrio sp. CC007]QFT34997.1 hypothetical protein FIU99_00905 [Vibrio sp. THAF64]QGM32896.1 hypothetical protein GGC04_00910 [Vibrio sp. THAF191d]
MSATLINQTLPTFDELMALAQDNPEAFNRFKKEMCEEMIQSASKDMRDRLWAQQSHIDRVVGHCKNPNHTNVVLMRELVSQMGKFHEALEGDVRDKFDRDVEVILLDEWR